MVVGQYGYFYEISSGDQCEADDLIDTSKEYGIVSEWVAECVKPNTEILNNLDGSVKLAKNVKENDTIVYYDFEENIMKTGIVSKVYVHKNATNFVKYTLNNGAYVEVTDYHPIYTETGWKSYTNRNGYAKPNINDKIKTKNGFEDLYSIEVYNGFEDCYDFEITSQEGRKVDNYYANGFLVQNSIK